MSSKKLLFVAVAAFGFGCAGAAENVTPKTTETARVAPKRVVKPLRPVGVANAMKAPMIPARSDQANAPKAPATPMRNEGGVGLHGPEKSYVEGFDPSGWGGPSTPRGGGPAAEDPYEDDGLGETK